MSTTSGRLARQRPTLRPHQRRNSRWYQRGYAPLPHGVWGDILEVTPKITSLVPNTSVVSVAQTVQINGTNFMPYSTVEIDGVDGPATYVSATRLTVSYTPGNIGTYGVMVNNDDPNLPGHTASNVMPYTVTASGELDPHVANPGNFTIPDIEAWVDAHPEMADELLASEQSRMTPRITLVDWLQGFISHRDDGTLP